MAILDVFSKNGTYLKTFYGYSKKVKNKKTSGFSNIKNNNFQTIDLPNKEGVLKPRSNDSENKVFNAGFDWLKGDKNFSGSFRLFSERPLCQSCEFVSDQFRGHFSKSKLYTFHNNGDIVKPSYLNKNPSQKFTFGEKKSMTNTKEKKMEKKSGGKKDYKDSKENRSK